MSYSISARFYQSAPGAVLQMSGRADVIGDDDWGLEGPEGFGVKATSAAPTNTSEFGGHTLETFSDDVDAQERVQDERFIPGDTIVAHRVVTTWRVRKALDANWAAGKYAFAYMLGPAGSILKASAPYHIR